MDDRFVGIWDLVAGPVTSQLTLTADGNYIHSLWNDYRRHWGTWALEPQNGQLFLALHLQDAFPRQEMGFNGWQPVMWPAVEPLTVMHIGNGQIDLYEGRMIREQAAGPPPPAYPTPPAFGQFPSPTPDVGQFPSPGSDPVSFAPNAFAAAMPPPAAMPTMPGPMPMVPSVVQQWQNQHATWNAIRTIVATTNANDIATTRQIGDAYAAQNTANLASQFANTQAMSNAVHAGARAFTASLNP